MSEALFSQAAEGRHEAESAGTTPARAVHAEVMAAMRELGVELSGRVPRRLTDDLAARADVVVTMGCGDACPYIPGKRYIDWEPRTRPDGLSMRSAASVTTSRRGHAPWLRSSARLRARGTRRSCHSPSAWTHSRSRSMGFASAMAMSRP
jgi:hypothetical protein